MMQKSTAVPRFGERRCLVDVGILMYLGDISEVWLGQRFGAKCRPRVLRNTLGERKGPKVLLKSARYPKGSWVSSMPPATLSESGPT